MPTDMTPEENEWRLYFCIVGEMWQAVRDKLGEDVVTSYLDEIEALAYTTSQDLLYRRCQHILNLARVASYSTAGL